MGLMNKWWVGRVDECTGFENRIPISRDAGSNPAPTAKALRFWYGIYGIRIFKLQKFVTGGALLFANDVAERVGFEPTDPFPGQRISSALHSTTLAPLLIMGL